MNEEEVLKLKADLETANKNLAKVQNDLDTAHRIFKQGNGNPKPKPKTFKEEVNDYV